MTMHMQSTMQNSHVKRNPIFYKDIKLKNKKERSAVSE